MPSITEVYGKLLDQFTDVPFWYEYWTIWCELIDEIEQTALNLQTLTWLETAEGVWLDRAGEIVGLPRPAEWLEDGLFTWDSTVVGERWDEGVWNSPQGIQTGNLADDDDYRPLLRAKAYCMHAPSSLPAIANTVYLAFGFTPTVRTTAVDVVTITVPTSTPQRDRFYIRQLAPVADNVTLILEAV